MGERMGLGDMLSQMTIDENMHTFMTKEYMRMNQYKGGIDVQPYISVCVKPSRVKSSRITTEEDWCPDNTIFSTFPEISPS